MNDSPEHPHFFRHQYGKLVSLLVCRVGAECLPEIEDAVQKALLKAVESWLVRSPDNPSAWLYKVAFNNLMSELRQNQNRERILRQSINGHHSAEQQSDEQYLSGDCQDETLRTFFACCSPDVPTSSQLIIALKIISGFNVDEIAQRLFTSEANVYKRLQRAKKSLKQEGDFLNMGSQPDFSARLDSVTHILYLMFTEGYLSVKASHSVRVELCEEALRLAHLLVIHTFGQTPKVFALLAMMYFHLARMSSRVNRDGSLILLEDQQREKWDQARIQTGMFWLEQSAKGDSFSRFHGEAAIAAEHCLAKDYTHTKWDRIVELYQILNSQFPSPLYLLNQAVALSEHQGPEAALTHLTKQPLPDWLKNSYLWHALMTDLYLRTNNSDLAKQHEEQAFSQAPTEAIKALMKLRFEQSASSD